MNIEILSRYSATVIFAVEADSKKQAVEAAVQEGANLYGANLRGADLSSADLYGADLYGADLRGANLYGANLRGANLRGANLYGADLRSADLRGADLYGANLYGADLYSANLRSADLRSANLYGADLYGANLRGADLSSADLYGANLRGANLSNTKGVLPIVPEVGAFVGFKKLANGVIAKLLIPEDAERVGGFTGRKCRAQKAVVLEGDGPSTYDSSFRYAVGATVTPTSWNNDPKVECSDGIHFFITRKEAEEYS